MKRYTLFLFAVILILGMLFASNVQAGKPKPTAYPPPDTEFEVQAYPAPDPNFPFPGNPPPDKPYVWGVYNLDGVWRWYVTKFTSAPVTNALIMLCTAQENPYEQVCYRHSSTSSALEYYGYEDGMSIYRSIQVPFCGWWGAMPDTSNWDGEQFELHQPNWYYIPCTVWSNPIYLPLTSRN